ncbi:molecular chaperone GrpE [Actinokineospora alba]|uniref:Protein GrpE n=1 Tax=Actinokineospora alba TaxID=504798 RepID=A0A1H0PZC4_9PSEU|nr:nucleotide exchange factor GrpE [Actinokineospora alba]TDP65985.1 molecular chaperone GrpE [Actinokineospora alba]SDI60811.1 molecular chaperone GrpE [Actinokineospora alba]SDP09798.1 molecular chaperone GrpE [Actinokineospora alba]
MTGQHSSDGEEPQVVVRDRRRIDPETGEIRTASDDAAAPAHAAADSGPESVPEPVQVDELDPAAEFKAQLDERTADLQRLQAEYANYRKRVDRDREVVATAAKAQVVNEMLSVLDDIERAGAHGDLTGAFKAVAEKLAAALQKAGLEPFGHEGEPFDPSVHEAVQHNTSPDVAGPTVTGVLRRGYRFGDRTLRAALVAVTDAEAGPVIVDQPADEQN